MFATGIRYPEDLNARDPELLIMGNFVPNRHEIKAHAIDREIDVVHGENGWFPHRHTLHADPLGFCWESSLTQMKFTKLSDEQRALAQTMLAASEIYPPSFEHPRPYVFLPLQTLQDKVNTCGLNFSDWAPLIVHVLAAVPTEFDVIAKVHPWDKKSLQALSVCDFGPRLKLIDGGDLAALIAGSRGVVGINSTVLYESRLMHNKPTWAYGQSWFTGHPEIIIPAERGELLPQVSLLDTGLDLKDERLTSYAAWFAYQLHARQISVRAPLDTPDQFMDWVHKRTYQSWLQHGEEIFS